MILLTNHGFCPSFGRTPKKTAPPTPTPRPATCSLASAWLRCRSAGRWRPPWPSPPPGRTSERSPEAAAYGRPAEACLGNWGGRSGTGLSLEARLLKELHVSIIFVSLERHMDHYHPRKSSQLPKQTTSTNEQHQWPQYRS